MRNLNRLGVFFAPSLCEWRIHEALVSNEVEKTENKSNPCGLSLLSSLSPIFPAIQNSKTKTQNEYKKNLFVPIKVNV